MTYQGRSLRGGLIYKQEGVSRLLWVAVITGLIHLLVEGLYNNV